MVLKRLRDLFKPKQINGPHTHEFSLKDTLNILVDPKCRYCSKTLNQLNKELDELNKPFAIPKKGKMYLVKGSGNA